MADLTDYPAWAAVPVMVGLAGLIGNKIFHWPAPVIIVIAVLLIGGSFAVLAVNADRKEGASQVPQPVPQPVPAHPVTPVGLAGSRIGYAGRVFTVLDDSAVRGDGRRASVVARDENGTVGLLFVGFGPDGTVVEARTEHTEWAPAQHFG